MKFGSSNTMTKNKGDFCYQIISISRYQSFKLILGVKKKTAS